MPLPKIQQPLFDLTIPSTKKKVKFRPFTVKEEKILLIAQESKDMEQIVLSIKQIINNCVENVNVEQLAMFDLEYILINLRSKSVGEVINFTITDPETEEKVKLELNLNDVDIQTEGHENKIQVSEDVYIIMRYPRIDQLLLLNKMNEENKSKILFDMMVNCIDMVVEGEEVYKTSEFTQDEIEEFVNSLSTKSIQDIKHFFDTMPTLKFEKKYKTKEGKEKTFVIKGTETFFI
jgi:hypothetical protein